MESASATIGGVISLALLPFHVVATRLGLATGAGLLALDIDPDHGGGAWLRAQSGRLPPTPHQRTGSGGWHLLYRVPACYTIKTTGPASNPKIGCAGSTVD